MDEPATKVISSALTMYDIMERRITLVEKLDLNRQPFPAVDVIYLATPTKKSVERISKDFDNKQLPRYGNVHLFFLDSVRYELPRNALTNFANFPLVEFRFICYYSKQFISREQSEDF